MFIRSPRALGPNTKGHEDLCVFKLFKVVKFQRWFLWNYYCRLSRGNQIIGCFGIRIANWRTQSQMRDKKLGGGRKTEFHLLHDLDQTGTEESVSRSSWFPPRRSTISPTRFPGVASDTGDDLLCWQWRNEWCHEVIGAFRISGEERRLLGGCSNFEAGDAAAVEIIFRDSTFTKVES